jgi:hypothetical protein
MFCGFEIWDIESVQKYKDSEPHEKFHVKCIKEQLGVHCKTLNDMGTLMIGNILPYILPIYCGSRFPRICHVPKIFQM